MINISCGLWLVAMQCMRVSKLEGCSRYLRQPCRKGVLSGYQAKILEMPCRNIVLELRAYHRLGGNLHTRRLMSRTILTAWISTHALFDEISLQSRQRLRIGLYGC